MRNGISQTTGLKDTFCVKASRTRHIHANYTVTQADTTTSFNINESPEHGAGACVSFKRLRNSIRVSQNRVVRTDSVSKNPRSEGYLFDFLF
jgi:hypothetical protein